jgi:hypothetical protein
MIIDCHCHAGKGDGFHAPWDTEARIEPHLRRARAAGIDKTIVFPIFNSDYAAANARLAKIVRSYPNELIGFAAINPARDAGRVESMVRRAVEEYGFRGLKIHGLDSFPKREVCEVASAYLARRRTTAVSGRDASSTISRAQFHHSPPWGFRRRLDDPHTTH